MAYDPFEEERKQRRLIEDAMGGPLQRLLREEEERRRIFEQPMYSKLVDDVLAQQREQDRLMDAYKNSGIEHYFKAEEERRRAFDVGSLASARAFQENLASALEPVVGSASAISAQMAELGIFDRIAAQQSEMMKVSGALSAQIEELVGSTRGVQAQFDAISEAVRAVTPSFDQFSRTFGIQSALAESLRGLSEQISHLDAFAGASSIRESAVWATLRDYYDFDDDVSVSQAFFEIGTDLDKPSDAGRQLTFEQIWIIIQVLYMVLGMYLILAGVGDYTEDDRARDNATAEAVARIEYNQQIQEVEEALAEASALAEVARINKLPRAFVREAANIRQLPNQKGERIARLGANTMLAIEEKEGKWLRVIFADPITGEGAEGWVYRSSVELMAEES